MNRFLRVSVAQINPTVGDLRGNREKILQAFDEARKRKSHLVTFPELAITGYPPEDLLLRKKFVSENIKVLRSLVGHANALAAVVGFVDRDKKGRIYNAAAVIFNKRLVAIYHKMYLPNYGIFDEKRYFTAGNQGLLVDFGEFRLGISICEDIWVKESYLYDARYAGSPSLLLNISASPYHAGKGPQRRRLVSRLARRVKAPIVYHNLVGGQDELVFDGGSMVVDRFGRVLAQAKQFEECILTTDILLGKKTPRIPKSLGLREVRSFAEIFSLEKGTPSVSEKNSLLSREGEVYKALVVGTRDYIRKNGFGKVLVGISGGIDSALVARIAVDALGSQNVLGVTMPSRFTSAATYRDAKILAGNLGIRCLEFGIGAVFQAYLGLFKEPFAGLPQDTTEENLQARIRGTILMALSNKFGYLVLTTGNKSEMATGYCTLYGDMAGGFAVIKDVPKTLVFKLVRYRNSLPPKNSIPASILKRAPTAELRPNQRDQDSLPPYSVLDKFLEAYVEKDLPVEAAVKAGVPRNVGLELARMIDANEYKRRQAPPGIKITPKAFGKDRRMPITNHYSSRP